MEIFIYTLSDPTTNQVRYVGKTVNLKKRYSSHICNFNKKNKKENWVLSLKNKNEKPLMEVVDTVPYKNWEFWERYWISQFKAWGFDLVNLTEGGDNVCSDKTRKKLKLAGKNRKQSPEAIEKTASANRGRKNTQEMKDKMSALFKGIKVKPDVLLKRAKAQWKPVLQFDLQGNFIKEYPNVKSAKNEINPINNSLGGCLKGKLKTWCGYKWEYKNK